MARTMIRGLSHVYFSEMFLYRRNSDLALRRFECGLRAFSLAYRSSAEGSFDRVRFSVEKPGALVSPGGSAPRLLPPRGRGILSSV